MTRAVAWGCVALAGVLLIIGLMGLARALLRDASGSQGPSQQVCQFDRWENQQLWPQGGGPPLPPGC